MVSIRQVRMFWYIRNRFLNLFRQPTPSALKSYEQVLPRDGRIFSSGHYILTEGLRTDRKMVISVTCDDVTINLDGNAVEGVGTQVGTIGIDVHGTQRVTICNGRVSGCAIGVRGDGAVDLTVEDVDFTGTLYIGIDCSERGLSVRRSRFAKFAGYEDEAYAIGVNNPGNDSTIEHNQFHHLYRQASVPEDLPGEGVGVVVSAGNRNCMIRHNWFENAEIENPTSIGIFVAKDAAAIIENNVILDFPYAIGAESPVQVIGNLMLIRYHFSKAIALHIAPGSVVRGNTMIGFNMPKVDGLNLAENLFQTEIPTVLNDDAVGQ